MGLLLPLLGAGLTRPVVAIAAPPSVKPLAAEASTAPADVDPKGKLISSGPIGVSSDIRATASPAGGWRKELPPVSSVPVKDSGLSHPEPVRQHVFEVRALLPEKANQGLPVRIRGTISYWDPTDRDCFVQDASGGIYVVVPATTADVSVGQRVEVEGKTAAGGFAPIIAASRFEVLGAGELPAPLWAGFSELATGTLDSQWIELDAIVRKVEEGPALIRVKLAAEGQTLWAQTPRGTDRAWPGPRVDALVRIRGVCGTEFNERRQRQGVLLFVASPRDFVERHAPAANPSMVRALSLLTRFEPNQRPGHRVQVQGQVVHRLAQGDFFVEDDSSGLRVAPLTGVGVALGESVELLGFPSMRAGQLVLEDAVVLRSQRRLALPRLKPGSLDHWIERGYENRRITLDGTLVSTVVTAEATALTVQTGARFVTVRSEQAEHRTALRRLRAGSEVRIWGVLTTASVDAAQVPLAQILLRDPSDVLVLRGAPWWTVPDAIWGLAVVGALVVAVLGWAAFLGRRVRQQTHLIQERLEHEAALEARFAAFMQHLPGIAFMKDAAGRYVYVNDSFQLAFGGVSGSWLGRRDEEVWPADVAARLRQSDQQVLTSGAVHQTVESLAGKEGESYWLTTRFLIGHGPGAAKLVAGIAVDVTERKRAEESLRKSEERFSKAFQASPTAVVIIALSDGRYVDVNERFLGLIGAERAQVLGGVAVEIDAWEDEIQRRRILTALSQGQAVREIESRVRSRSGNVHTVLCSAERIELGDAPSLLMIIHDITERLNLEEQFRQAQKMEAVGQLAAGVAHDFNNILTVIQGNAELLATESCLNEDAVGLVREVCTAAGRAAGLTRQLLVFSRKQILQPRALDVNEVIGQLTKMLSRLIGEHIHLQFNYSSALPAVCADPGMLEQLILNLTVNARDAMPNGGHLVISTASVDVSPAKARLNPEARPGPFVRLTVSDTGCGMDASILPRIFEPFFTTKGVGKGTGLGLATVYGIVKQHQGWLEVQSTVGQGSTFHVFLPGQTRSQRAEAMALREEPIPRGSETVLIVEDEPALCDLTHRILVRQGYHVLSAGSGLEALELWKTHGDSVDLVVTDMVMPHGVSGRALAERLRQQHPKLRVLFTSGYNPEMLGADFILPPQTEFLAKPFEPRALACAVRRCLDRTDQSDSEEAFAAASA